jgi:hypothetical protein
MGYTHGHKWTKEQVHEEALKYTRRVDFQKKSPLAESYARRNNWLNEVCSHMVRLRTNGRTVEDCKNIALKYSVMKDFQKKENGVYLYSKRRGWLHEITSHMKKNIRWEHRKEEVHQVALKYKHRGEFCLKDEMYYEVARRWGWLDDICGHMTSVGNKYKRLVYVYEFEDMTVYVGLTGNDIKRSDSHSKRDNSPVYRHQQKTGLNPTKKILTDGYIYSEDAKVIEHETIMKYREEGWNVLNRAKAGGLGGSDRIWTDEKIKETISKYTHLSEFRKNEPLLVHTLYRRGDYREHVKVLIDDGVTYWNEELVIETISKYTYLKDFVRDHPGARGWIGKMNKEHLLGGLVNGNIKRYVINQWNNKEEALKEASKYNIISDLMNKNNTLFRAAKKQGWLDEIKENMIPKFLWTKDKVKEIVKNYTCYTTFRKENKNAYDSIKKYGWEDCIEHLIRTTKLWTIETAKQEALKYNGRNDFLEGSGGAYYYLKNKGLLDEYTKHMELKNVKGYKEPLHTCSVCGEKIGGIGNLKRWHEGNCNPNRPNSNKKLNKSR